MPRGNDTADAVKELSQQLGDFQNAEELINGWRARRDKHLNAAGPLKVNKAKTEDLDLEKVDKAIGDDLELLDAKVRGTRVVAVGEDVLGRTHKVVLDADYKPLTDEDPLKRELSARDTLRKVRKDEAPGDKAKEQSEALAKAAEAEQEATKQRKAAAEATKTS
jgi:hypothetical protein